MELYTRRSISECLGDAWTLLSTNLRRITKSLWLPTLLLALVSAIVTPVMLIVEEHQTEGNITATDFLLDFICVIAICVAIIYFEAKIFKLLNEQTTTFCVKRMLKVIGIMAVLFIVITIIFAALMAAAIFTMQSGTVSIGVGIALIVFACLIYAALMVIVGCPTSYANMKYMIEPDMKLKDYRKACKVGLKNCGNILGLTLLCTIIIIIAQSLISLPETIALLAVKFSMDGMAYGDPSGLPAAFTYIFAVTSFISCIVTALLMIWYLFAEYYLYASIEAKTREAVL